jgi:hypothetical protein
MPVETVAVTRAAVFESGANLCSTAGQRVQVRVAHTPKSDTVAGICTGSGTTYHAVNAHEAHK